MQSIAIRGSALPIADTHFSFDNIMCKGSIVSCSVLWMINVLKFCQPPFVKNMNKFYETLDSILLLLLKPVRSYDFISMRNLFISLAKLCIFILFMCHSRIYCYELSLILCWCTCKKVFFTFEHADESFNDDNITSLSFVFLLL